MKKFLPFFLLMFLLAGCGADKLDSAKNPSELVEKEQIIKTALENTRKLSDGAFEFDFTGKLVEVAETEKEFTLKGKAVGNYLLADEITRARDFKFNFNLEYTDSSLADKTEKVALEAIVKDRNLYAKLVEVPMSGVGQQAALFKGSWFKFPISESTYNDRFLGSVLKSSKYETATEIEQKQLELFENTNFISEITVKDNVKIEGENMTVYNAIYNPEALYSYVVESAEIQSEPLNAEDKANYKKILDTLELNVEFTINENELVRFIAGNLKVNPTQDNKTYNLDVRYDLEFSPAEQNSEIVAPASAQEFPLFGAQGL